MKKNTFLVLLIFALLLQNFSTFSAQSAGGFEIQKEANEKAPDVNIAQGVPNVNFPLLSAPSLSGKLNINISLNYIANNISSHHMISDVGAGWDIFAGFSVSRTSHLIVEDYKKQKGTDNIMHCTSNIYQYNIPGKSGKFIINYDHVKHELTTTQFKVSKEKILIEKNTDTLTYKIKSFTVIDENGLKYVFDKTDISYYARGSLGNTLTALYHNNFNISKILDEKNNVLVTYDYDLTSKNISQGSTSQFIERNKLTRITILNTGIIDFVYTKSPVYPTDRDNYTLQKITLKDPGGTIIQQAVFGYNDFNLSSLSIQGRSAQGIKKYTFDYYNNNDGSRDPFGFINQNSYCTLGEGRIYGPESIYPPFAPFGSLATVHLPTGGKVEYTYESNTLPGADSPRVIKIAEIPYNTNTTTQYPFSIPANTYQQLFFSNETELHYALTAPADPSPFSYQVVHPGTNTILSLADYHNCDTKVMTPFMDVVQNYKLYIYGTNFQGIMTIYGLKSQPDPENHHPAQGLRIRSIKKYESEAAATPSVWLDYNYDLFTMPGTPSSEIYTPSDYQGAIGLDAVNFNERIIYTNVKVKDLIKNYSTRYTYASPGAVETMFNIPPSVMELTDFNSELKNGTLLFTRQYDASDKLIYEQEFNYTMDTKANSAYINASPIPWIKNQGIVGRTYMDNNIVLTTTSILTYESEYGNLKNEKSTDQNGDITEKNYLYASDLNNTKLLAANLSGIPLIQETKTTKNGITRTVSKSEIKFDDPSHSWPTSSVSYDVISGAPETDATLDRYDNYGNLLQSTSKSGIPTTFVYGYNNTAVIAKIEGITYDQLQGLGVSQAIIAASNLDAADATKEADLISALDAFRKNQGMKNYYITTYTYDPLIGITSETSPLGIRKKYLYDNANRLVKVTDMNGAILEEYKSNLKQH